MGDLRVGERWSRWQRLRNGAWYGGATLALAGARSVPARQLPAVGRALGSAAWATFGLLRRRAQCRLDLAFGQSPVTAFDVFRGLGEDLADAVRLLDPGEAVEETLRLSEEVEPTIREALAAKRGVVFVTAHLGPIERMAALVASRGYPVATLARESYDPRFTALYERLRGSRGVRTIYRGRPGVEMSILRRLREGYLVGFPMDLAGRGMACGTFEFLGEQAPLPLGPATLALRTGAAVLVGTPVRAKGGEMMVSVTKVGVRAGWGELELTKHLGNELETRIRALPEHWPWMHSLVFAGGQSSTGLRPAGGCA